MSLNIEVFEILLEGECFCRENGSKGYGDKGENKQKVRFMHFIILNRE